MIATLNGVNQSFNNMNQPTGGTFNHDAEGNLSSYNGWTYTYDAQNRLKTAIKGNTSAYFYYDGKNRQIARSINGAITFSVWDDWELVEEYGTGNVRTAAYLQGAHGPVKSLLNNVYYYQDSLGSTSHIADSSGALVEYYKYNLYGKPTVWRNGSEVFTAPVVNDLFSGERWISEMSMYDLRNRFYSPDLGRFLQPDPIGFKGDASNLYRYCGNDWANKTDPLGLIDPFEAAGNQAIDAVVQHVEKHAEFYSVVAAGLAVAAGEYMAHGHGNPAFNRIARQMRTPRTTIIGNNQHGRVIPYAQKTQARTIDNGKTQAQWEKMTTKEKVKAIDGALRERIKEGDHFKDIGPDGKERAIDGRKIELNRLQDRAIPVEKVPASEVNKVIEASKQEPLKDEGATAAPQFDKSATTPGK